jgi:hypothetical protein
MRSPTAPAHTSGYRSSPVYGTERRVGLRNRDQDRQLHRNHSKPDKEYDADVACPTGKVAVGGGGYGSFSEGFADLGDSLPTAGGTRCQAGFEEPNGTYFAVGDTLTYTVYAT